MVRWELILPIELIILFFISLGIGVGIKEINDLSDLGRVLSISRLDRHHSIFQTVKGDVKINEHSSEKSDSNYGQQWADK